MYIMYFSKCAKYKGGTYSGISLNHAQILIILNLPLRHGETTMQMQNVLIVDGLFIMFYLCSYNHMLIMFLLIMFIYVLTITCL